MSPTTRRTDTASTADAGHKKRHYDADTVRQYISRQQEERKRRQAEEKRAMREEAERRNQRLQELYRKQREMAKTAALPSEGPVAPVQKRLQETYNKLMLEGAQLGEEAPQTQPAAPYSQMVWYIRTAIKCIYCKCTRWNKQLNKFMVSDPSLNVYYHRDRCTSPQESRTKRT